VEPHAPDVPEAFMIAPMLNVFAKVPLGCGRASVALVLLASRLRVHAVVVLACVGRAPIIAIRATSAKVTGRIFLLTKQTNTFFRVRDSTDCIGTESIYSLPEEDRTVYLQVELDRI